jgi:nucleoside-diphosphate-sugar epimerase
MKILITGSTGFVGRNLVPILIENGHEILEVTRSTKKSKILYGFQTSKIKITNNHEKFKNKIIDFQPDVVIHLASYLSSSDDYETMKNLIDSNIIFLSRLLDAISKVNLKLFINTGTFAEYKTGAKNVLEPAYLYAATKTASRSFVNYYSKTFNFKELTVIPYTIYGGEDSQKKIIDYFYDSIRSKKKLDFSLGFQKLDFIHVSDIVKLFNHLIDNFDSISNKSVIYAGTGVGTSLRDLANLIEKLTQKKLKLNWGGKNYRSNDIMDATATVSLNNFEPKWESAIDLEQGLNLFLKNRYL